MIQVTGAKEAVDTFEGMAAKAQAAAEDAARAGAELVAQEARDRVAVDTGETKESIRVESTSEGGVATADVIAGGAAVFLEFSPDEEPFLRPAADEKESDVTHAMGDIITGALK